MTRQEAINRLEGGAPFSELYDEEWENALVMAIEALKAEPIKHGRWLPSGKGDCTYICSECGFVRDAYVLEEKAFCPHCGAKMDEQQEAE